MITTSTKPFADFAAIESTVAAVSEQRELGKVSFTMLSESAGGLTAKTITGPLIQAGEPDLSRRGKFTLNSDEPIGLMGTDTAVSPAEYILKGLAGCYMVTLASLAAARAIEIEAIRLTLSFDIDLSGFLGIDKTVRKGAQQIAIDIEIDSPGTPREVLMDLVQALEATSPIRDTLANPVPVATILR
ncbi:OsmC family protein [Arthrobacter glacialis]|uniref:Osmotically inducible protein C n=1 Tax=Arthrobacter glacialis TaxID=1664 RepID=A0A2S3ZRL7_ARTGL|nr:OsmC family protein [Arthrobacter glacialis]POH71754.1 osmotically inducible protein C [Arthrobacter glacialis]